MTLKKKDETPIKFWKSIPLFIFQAVYDLIKKVKKTASDEQRKRSCRTVSGTIADDCELLVSSQKESPVTHFSMRKIARQVEISKFSTHCILRKAHKGVGTQRKMRIWSHLLKKPLMEILIFYALKLVKFHNMQNIFEKIFQTDKTINVTKYSRKEQAKFVEGSL